MALFIADTLLYSHHSAGHWVAYTLLPNKRGRAVASPAHQDISSVVMPALSGLVFWLVFSKLVSLMVFYSCSLYPSQTINVICKNKIKCLQYFSTK